MRIKSKTVATWAVVICLAVAATVALAAVSGVKTMTALVGMEPPALLTAEPRVRAASPARDSATQRSAPTAAEEPRSPTPVEDATLRGTATPTPVNPPAAADVAPLAAAGGGAPGAAAQAPRGAAGAGGDSGQAEQAAVAEREPCGDALCAPGKVCCNASCGTCTEPGEKCSQLVCGMSVVPASAMCGSSTCNVGEICCNASCGVCTLPGAPCDAARRCDNAIQYPQSPACGMTTCNVGSVCCNPSCGICAPPGEPCSQRTCD